MAEPLVYGRSGWRAAAVAKLKQALPDGRFQHSLQVEKVARELAVRHGLNVALAEAAGLLHDCAKSFSLPQMQRLALAGGLLVDKQTWDSRALMHAPVGALVAQRDYGLDDALALAAIRWHTTGCPGMTPLEQAVYLADVIEPGRKDHPGLAEIRQAADEDLAEAMRLSLRGTAAYVEAGRQTLHPLTRETLAWFDGQTGQK